MGFVSLIQIRRSTPEREKKKKGKGKGERKGGRFQKEKGEKGWERHMEAKRNHLLSRAT